VAVPTTETTGTGVFGKKRGKKGGKGVAGTVQNMQGAASVTAYAQGTKYAQIMNGLTYGFVVVTGDRRAGATTFALQIAAHFAQKVQSLYVDFDIERRGSLFRLSYESLASCGPTIQNGLGALRIGTNVSSVAYRPPNQMFDTLISSPNYEHTDESLHQTVLQLMQQHEYNLVVIDCPITQIRHISDILSMASVFICVNGDINNCSSTLFCLDDLNPMSQIEEAKKAKCLNERDIAMLYRGRYVITGNVTEQQFLENMRYLESLYSLSSQSINWTKLPIAGTSANIGGILQNMV